MQGALKFSLVDGNVRLYLYIVYLILNLYCRMVRSSAAHALGKLSALSTRVDPLVGDLLTALQVINMFLSIIYFHDVSFVLIWSYV